MSSASSYEHMALFEQLYKLVGAKIKLKVPEAEFEGIIEHVLPKSNLLTLEHVYYVPNRTYMGNLNFFFQEIQSFTVLETAESLAKVEKWDYVSRILDGESFGHTYRITDVIDDLDEDSEFDEDAPYPDELEVDDFVLDLPEDLRLKLPHDNIIIEAVTLEFNQAIKHISLQSTIGVSFDGPKISRLGKLSWISICTPSCVFLFDIELLGKIAFDEGLRGIFQNKNIEKVIHDCRQPSDCLSHLFKTELVNVFDTQVADYIVNTQRYSGKPAFKFVSSLDGCLRNHLDVPQEYLYNRQKYYSYEDELIFYRVRPVSNDYINVLIKNVIYLCLLKEKLTELMLNPFRKAVDVYLNVLANASEPELLLEPSVPEMVPPALLMQGIKTVKFVEAQEIPIVPLVCKFKDPQNGTFVAMNEEEPIDDSKNLSSEASVERSTDVYRSNKSFSLKSCTEPFKTNCQKPTYVNKSNVVFEKMCLSNSKRHIDNVYHQLVNNLQASNISENVIDVKPSQDYVSSFVVKKCFSDSNLFQNKVINSKSNAHHDINCISDLEKCKSDSYETLSESSSDVSLSSSDSCSSDMWAKLRSEFNDSRCSELSGRKLRFVPAGMSH